MFLIFILPLLCRHFFPCIFLSCVSFPFLMHPPSAVFPSRFPPSRRISFLLIGGRCVWCKREGVTVRGVGVVFPPSPLRLNTRFLFATTLPFFPSPVTSSLIIISPLRVFLLHLFVYYQLIDVHSSVL